MASVSYGFGGGARIRKKEQEDEHDEESEPAGGGRGGVSARPIGGVEITPGNRRFICFADKKKLVGAMIIGFFTGIFKGKRLSEDKRLEKRKTK